MTVSRNDIQKLITEIDPLLRTDEQAPDGSEDLIRQEQTAVLEKVRWYLGDLSRQVEVPGTGVTPLAEPEQQTATAIAQAVMAQMNLQRQDWLQPMQLELETLRQQRETLRREIRHLETHQRQMTHDLLQTVMQRCSDALKQEVATVFDQMQGQFNAAIAGAEADSNGAPALQQLDWIAKLRSLEQQADQLFLSLDQTFHQVFGSLEQDIQSYHQSLNQKLGEIHELQQQTTWSAAPMLAQASDVPVSDMVAKPTPMQPLQLDASRPLPALEPLEEAIAHSPIDPVEQVLHLDLPQSPAHPVPSRSTTEDAWEAWDEYLFTHDPADALPVVAPEPEGTIDPEPLSPDPVAAHPIAPVSPQQPIEDLEAPVVAEDVARSLPQEVQQELFGSLSDPAQVAEPAPPTELTPTQPVESVLFGDPVPEVVQPNVAVESEAELEEIDPDGPTLEETIASIEGLLEQVTERMVEVEEDATDAELEQDEKISPGETLLTTDDIATSTASSAAILDDQQLQQLATDLAQFEDPAAADAAKPSSQAAPSDHAPDPSTPITSPTPTPQPEVAAPETATVQMSESIAEAAPAPVKVVAEAPESEDNGAIATNVWDEPSDEGSPDHSPPVTSTEVARSLDETAEVAQEQTDNAIAPPPVDEMPQPIASSPATGTDDTLPTEEIPPQAVVTVLSDLNWEQDPQDVPIATDNLAEAEGDLWSSTPQTVQATQSS